MSVLAVLAGALLAFSHPIHAADSDSLSTKVIENFSPQDWKVGRDTRASAEFVPLDGFGMEVQIPFSGKGFQYLRIEPVTPITIPGQLKKVSVRINMSNPGAGSKLVLRDAYGVWKEYDFPRFPPDTWETIDIEVPDDVAQPVAIQGFVFHNYGTRNKKTDVKIGLRGISVETDLSRANPETGAYLDWKPDPSGKHKDATLPDTPLFEANLTSSVPGHFFAGTEPELILALRNWRPDPALVRATISVQDESGNVIYEDVQQQSVDAVGSISWKPPVKAYGPYRADLKLERAGGDTQHMYLRFAKAPKPHDLTVEQKLASPYGMNYHAGHGLFLTPFREAGIVWFRDYAFTWSWLKRAKGANHNFAGWPGYPGIMQTYRDAGAMVMPVLVRSIPKTEIVEGKVENNIPADREWTSHLADVLSGFPDLVYWELDNEYALKSDVKHAENAIHWSHYEDYHKTFGDGLAYLGHGELKAVENGRHGIRPDLVEAAIDDGSFANIDVINFHHYCGVDAPEINVRNYNTGSGGRKAGMFRDKVSDVVKIANKDGKEREVFITEFGWDTLAGFIVSEEQQAAYLPRAYMMLTASGVDRAFWYWHFDSPTPSQFFDGCGLMTDRKEPKPSLCTMAGITHLLPSLNCVGEFNVGPDTQGYIFKENGQYIAAAWRIAAGDDAIELDFGPGVKLYDRYANPLAGTKATLSISPVYAVGLSEKSILMRKSAYALYSHHYMSVTAGEKSKVVVQVTNRNDQPLQSSLSLKLPTGWTADSPRVAVDVPAGESKLVELSFHIPEDEKTGVLPLAVDVSENDKLLTTLYLQANVLEPYYLTVGSVPLKQGPVEITATVENQGNVTQNPQIALSLPKSWKALSSTQTISELKPEESREVTLSLEWSDEIPEGEIAEVVVSSPGVRIAEPIIPPFIHLNKVPSPGWFKGNPEAWPAKNKLPQWMLGSTYGEPRAQVWLGWTEQGLWGALVVDDSKVQVADPRYFWRTDALELFIDTDNDKKATEYGPGDHQFWLVPQPESGSVYLGQWKRGNELEDTRQDIPMVHAYSRATETGYLMEFVIPWKDIQGGAPKAGAVWGINLNLSVKGTDGDREVYWPRRKSNAIQTRPESWGAVQLTQ